jgi:hypothetical protein
VPVVLSAESRAKRTSPRLQIRIWMRREVQKREPGVNRNAISKWCQNLGLDSFFNKLVEQGVDSPTDLTLLTEAGRNEMALVASMGIMHKRKFINAIEKLKATITANTEDFYAAGPAAVQAAARPHHHVTLSS